MAENRIVWVLIFVACFTGNLSGCTTAYVASVSTQSLKDLRLKSAYIVSRSADWRLSASTATGLVDPQDNYPSKRNRSAFALNQSLRDELMLAFPATESLGVISGLDAALQAASERGKQVLFWPVLGEIEDNLSSKEELLEGTGLHPHKKRKPDRVAFQILIYDVRSGRLLDNASVVARGRMWSAEHDGPLSLYSQAVKHYVNTIAGNSAAARQ